MFDLCEIFVEYCVYVNMIKMLLALILCDWLIVINFYVLDILK